MVWSVFLNNQTVRQASIQANAQPGGYTRYIFIEGRNVPIILTDEARAPPVTQNWAVGINDGVHDHFQLGYEGGGTIYITLQEVDGVLQYTASSTFGAAVIHDLP